MSQEQKKRPPMTEEERQRRIERLRRERRRKRRQQAMIMRAAVLGVLILILIGSIALVSAQVRRSKAKKAEEKAKQEKLIQEEEAKNKQRKESIDQADVMAQGYDYDGAIELLKSLDNYDKDADIVAKIAGYEADKSTLVAVNMNEITHIFYHSLVVDPERGFAGNDSAAAGFKQWMTTVDEFNKITQAMYDNGYVLILLKDKEAEIDKRGNYSAAELTEYISMLREGGEISPKEFPVYLSTFITDYLNTPAESTVLHEDHLATLYYEYAMKCGNKFVAAWFEFNLNINNILVAFTSRKFKWDIASNIVGNTEVCEALRTSSARDFGLSGEVDVFESLVKISEITELVEREKKLDALRWNWMEDAIFFDYFTVERIFAFLLKLEMIERWISLDKERGNQLFRSIIESLKNDVQIPAEFR